MFFKDFKQFSLPETEKRVLKFWQENHIVEKALKFRKGKKRFVFYEGPPGANGMPGMHHVLARVYKDIVLRYKTMQGFDVPRKSGWDTHGLPVELTAERELGLKSKKDIEKFGIAAFNAKCRELVWKYKNDWERLTERIGFWLDLENPYITYDNTYIESLWWVISRFSKKGYLYKGHKVVPWCTRCGTALSSHEVALGYEEVTDRSVYVKFKLKLQPEDLKANFESTNIFILAWTTTPWTLPGNQALAISPSLSYVAVKDYRESVAKYYILEESRLDILKKEIPELQYQHAPRKIASSFLEGKSYEPLFKISSLKNEKSHKIYSAKFVTATDGTGVVHIAPMYGEDDYELGKREGLPQHHTVDETGHFTKDAALLNGMYAKGKDSEEKIIAYLKENGNFLSEVPHTHEYPFCWRCHTPLLYYARTSWFVAVSKIRKKLLSQNAKINWVPEHIKKGRFGEWLKEAKDWNFSRERYWGTPLPIWECASCGERQVVPGFEDLAQRAIRRNTFLFLRHGLATNNIQKICGPARDIATYTSRLLPEGMKTAQHTAEELKKSGTSIDMIVSSPLARAKETADIVGKVLGAPVSTDPRLGEVNPGVFEGRLVKEHHAYFKSELEMFFKAPPEGESRNDVKRRMWAAIRHINETYKGKTILIVSHGDPLWVVRGALEGLDEKGTLKVPYPNLGKLYPIEWKGLPLNDEGAFDVHRPYIDKVLLSCACGGTAKRVSEVVDVWFDSGAMPYAQQHYPFEYRLLINRRMMYPAEFISEAVDQTRGWFYTLLAVATLLGYEAPYENVISLGLIHDKFGRKMSKSKGNVVDPWEMAEKHGVDAIRWYFFTATPPGEPKNFDENEMVKAVRRFHLLFYNSLSFLLLYRPSRLTAKNRPSGHVLDRWIMARLHETSAEVTRHLNRYEIREAALSIETFVEDLSRWHIRRSRRRFQKPANQKEHEEAFFTLRTVLIDLSKIAAPFVPFLSEAVYRTLEEKGKKTQSVHLTNWPKHDGKKIYRKLLGEMTELREIASEALALRAKEGVKIRQPLQTLTVRGRRRLSPELAAILKDEVNVKEIIFEASQKRGLKLATKITPELREEGLFRELVRVVQDLRQEAGLRPKDRIMLFLDPPPVLKDVILKKEDVLLEEVNAKAVELKRSPKFDAELDSKFDGEPFWAGVRRAT